MKILIDTQSLLWFVEGDPRLSTTARQMIENPVHHRDPFDRLILVQSQVENIPLISSDVMMDAYPVQRLW